jgi:hypothetical protein
MIVVIISIASYITWAFDVPARLRQLAAAKTVLSAASRALMSKTSASTGVALARTVAAATRVARIGRMNFMVNFSYWSLSEGILTPV